MQAWRGVRLLVALPVQEQPPLREATIRYRMRIGSAITPTKTGSEIFQLPPSMPIAPTITGTGGGFRNRLDLEEGNKTDDDKIMAEWGKSKLGG